MIYRIALLSKEKDDFKMEIEADPTCTFLELNNLIVKKLKYSEGEVAMFYSCDDEWEPYQEITLFEMDNSSENDSYLMENTALETFLQDEGDKMIYMHDVLNNRGLFMSLREVKPGSMKGAKCTKLKGEIPEQIKIEEFIAATKTDKSILDQSDFYGTDEFSEDEFDADGYSEIDMSEVDL